MADADYASSAQPDPKPGPFLAKVVSHLDPTYMGVLEVEILRPTGNTGSEGQLHQVKYMSPFLGQTNVAHLGQDPDDYNNTQKSYGMWMIPPDPGCTVVVIFIDGDPKRGYWIGCVPDESSNFMIPGIAATQRVVEDVDPDANDNYGRVPVAEYNKITPGNDTPIDPTQNLKPRHPFTDVLIEQGLELDSTRGITTSSARRETPSMVFGISTPGPIDKQDGAKQGSMGKLESRIENAYVSRLGGSTFVMDDGDDKYIRKTLPTDGPPEYANVEEGDTEGEVTIPHNELIRLRTRTGHQILLHNSEDLIYIGNARGTSWIELSSDGKIDIYAEDSISVHTKQDFNFYADRDINLEAGRNINLKATNNDGLDQTEGGRIRLEAVGDMIVTVDGDNFIDVTGNHHETVGMDYKLTVTGEGADGNLDINVSGYIFNTSGGSNETNAGGNIIETAPEIHMNGPEAELATEADPPDPLRFPLFVNPTEVENEDLPDSIMVRIPTHEPWPHHENLDPASFKPDQTDREVEGDIPRPDAWKVYTTTTDTFKKYRD